MKLRMTFISTLFLVFLLAKAVAQNGYSTPQTPQLNSNPYLNYQVSGFSRSYTKNLNVLYTNLVRWNSKTILKVLCASTYKGEFSNGYGLWVQKSFDEAKTWTDPVEFWDTTNARVQNPISERIGNALVILFKANDSAAISTSVGVDISLGELFRIYNNKDTINFSTGWSKDSVLGSKYGFKNLTPMGNIIHAGDGRWHAACFAYQNAAVPNATVAEMFCSEDGINWKSQAKIYDSLIEKGPTHRWSEPEFAANGYNGTKLLMVCRNFLTTTRSTRPGIFVSNDAGNTWVYKGFAPYNEYADTSANSVPSAIIYDSTNNGLVICATIRTSPNAIPTPKVDSIFLYAANFDSLFNNPNTSAFYRIFAKMRLMPSASFKEKGYPAVLQMPYGYLFTIHELSNITIDSTENTDNKFNFAYDFDVRRVTPNFDYAAPLRKYKNIAPVYNPNTGFYDIIHPDERWTLLPDSTLTPFTAGSKIFFQMSSTTRNNTQPGFIVRSGRGINGYVMYGNGNNTFEYDGGQPNGFLLLNSITALQSFNNIAFGQKLNHNRVQKNATLGYLGYESVDTAQGDTYQSGWHIQNIYNGLLNTAIYGIGNKTGIGSTALSGYLTLHASSADLPALVIPQGTLSTTPIAGEFGSFDGNDFYATDNTNTRRALATVSGAQTLTDKTISYTNNTIIGVQPEGVAAANGTSGTVTQTMDKISMVTVTPTGNIVFNATGGQPGQVVQFTITSGNTASTITFGKNFKSQGALSTGGISGKVFTVTFGYDGTNWDERERISTGM